MLTNQPQFLSSILMMLSQQKTLATVAWEIVLQILNMYHL